MKIEIGVTYDDGTKAVAECGPSDYVKFERQFDKSTFDLGADARLEHFLFLAYTALRRKGQAGDDFDDWCDTVAELTPDFGETPAPLGQGVTTTSSPA